MTADTENLDDAKPKVTILPARKAKGAFSASDWAIKRSGISGKSAAHEARVRGLKNLKGGRPKK